MNSYLCCLVDDVKMQSMSVEGGDQQIYSWSQKVPILYRFAPLLVKKVYIETLGSSQISQMLQNEVELQVKDLSGY